MSAAYIAILKGYQAYAEDIGKYDIAQEIAEEIAELEGNTEEPEFKYFRVTESLAEDLSDEDTEVISVINDVYEEKGEIDSTEAVLEIEDKLKENGISVDADYLGDMIVKSKEMIDVLNEDATQVSNIGQYKRSSIDLIENEDNLKSYTVSIDRYVGSDIEEVVKAPSVEYIIENYYGIPELAEYGLTDDDFLEYIIDNETGIMYDGYDGSIIEESAQLKESKFGQFFINAEDKLKKIKNFDFNNTYNEDADIDEVPLNISKEDRRYIDVDGKDSKAGYISITFDGRKVSEDFANRLDPDNNDLYPYVTNYKNYKVTLELPLDFKDNKTDNKSGGKIKDLAKAADTLKKAAAEFDNTTATKTEESVSFKDAYICKGCGNPLSKCTCSIKGLDEDDLSESLNEEFTFEVSYDAGDNFSKVIKITADSLRDAMQKFKDQYPDKEITSIMRESINSKEAKVI